jgi:death on curing protein
MILFPSVDEALLLHEELMIRFGGARGVRDLGLLESALFRPQTGYYEDTIAMAAALMESLLINHSFADGNKRMAFFLTDIFLRMNGAQVHIQPKIAYRFIVKLLAQQTFRHPTIVKWLRQCVVALR